MEWVIRRSIVFLNSNPGLKSRFSMHYHFEDYVPSELLQIADVALRKEEVTLSSEAHDDLAFNLTELYRKRDRTFGNGRLVNHIIDQAKIYGHPPSPAF
ncbi:MAG: hypothetical protein IPI42_14685 [Saprospiraceae bacterium]|nr:hypothetical protein [Candidatus Parvibacillus calidus]